MTRCVLHYGTIFAERLSARHLILQDALGQSMYVYMYIRPSRSSTHARVGPGGAWTATVWHADHGGGDVFGAMDEKKRHIQSHG